MSLWLIGAAMPFKFCAKAPFQRVVDIAGEDGLEIVWNELRAFEKYSEWNTFTTRVAPKELPVKAGTRASLDVTMMRPFSDKATSTMLGLEFQFRNIEEKKRICWSYNLVPPSLQWLTLSTYRCMEMRLGAEGYAEVCHFDENMGPLAPVIQLFFQRSIEEGFRRMNADLKLRVATRNL